MSPIIEKIRKLLSLSKSSNANEAAVAAAAAQRLMTEHQIAEAEVEDGEQHEQASLSEEPLDTLGARAPSWKEVLSSQLSQMHGCKVWRETTRGGGLPPSVRTRIVGRPSDVASVRYLYAWLTSEIVRLTRKHGSGRGLRYSNSYRNGAVNGCLAAMWEARREVRATATGAALVRVDARAEEAQAEQQRLTGELKPARPVTFKRDPEAYVRGVAAGRGLHTGAKLGATTGTRLLGDGS